MYTTKHANAETLRRTCWNWESIFLTEWQKLVAHEGYYGEVRIIFLLMLTLSKCWCIGYAVVITMSYRVECKISRCLCGACILRVVFSSLVCAFLWLHVMISIYVWWQLSRACVLVRPRSCTVNFDPHRSSSVGWVWLIESLTPSVANLSHLRAVTLRNHRWSSQISSIKKCPTIFTHHVANMYSLYCIVILHFLIRSRTTSTFWPEAHFVFDENIHWKFIYPSPGVNPHDDTYVLSFVRHRGVFCFSLIMAVATGSLACLYYLLLEISGNSVGHYQCGAVIPMQFQVIPWSERTHQIIDFCSSL